MNVGLVVRWVAEEQVEAVCVPLPDIQENPIAWEREAFTRLLDDYPPTDGWQGHAIYPLTDEPVPATFRLGARPSLYGMRVDARTDEAGRSDIETVTAYRVVCQCGAWGPLASTHHIARQRAASGGWRETAGEWTCPECQRS